jgi:hypothetical protein
MCSISRLQIWPSYLVERITPAFYWNYVDDVHVEIRCEGQVPTTLLSTQLHQPEAGEI